MSTTSYAVYTIGRYNHSTGEFLVLLQMHGADEATDVRFIHAALNVILDKVEIAYTLLGGELGGRPADRSCCAADGRVLYERLAEADSVEGSDIGGGCYTANLCSEP